MLCYSPQYVFHDKECYWGGDFKKFLSSVDEGEMIPKDSKEEKPCEEVKEFQYIMKSVQLHMSSGGTDMKECSYQK